MNTYVKINYDKELSFEERDSLGDWYSVYEIDSPFRAPDSDDKIILDTRTLEYIKKVK